MSINNKRSIDTADSQCCKRRRVALEEKHELPAARSEDFFTTLPNRTITSSLNADSKPIRYMSDDPAFAQTLPLWQNYVVAIKGAQGSGKTIFYLKSIGALLRLTSDAKIIVTSSHVATLCQLYDLCTTGKLIPPSTSVAIRTSSVQSGPEEWNLLFCHSLSLHKHIRHELDLFVIDEITASQEQDVSWKRRDAKDITNADRFEKAIRIIINNSQRQLLCCAQLAKVQIDYFRELTQSSKPILLLRSLHQPPIVRLVPVTTHASYLDIVWSAVLAGERMAVAIGTKVSAQKHHRWLNEKIRIHNKHETKKISKNASTCWTGESMAVVRKSTHSDLSTRLEEIGTVVLWFTSALGPGTSIGSADMHYWAKRGLIICKNTGPTLNTMAQLPGRFRNICDTTIYCYIEPRRRRQALQISRIDYPLAFENAQDSITGNMVRRMRKTVANEIRLDILRERELVTPREILQHLQLKFDHAEIVLETIAPAPECTVWQHLFPPKKQRNGLLFHTAREIRIEEQALLSNPRKSGNSIPHRDTKRVMELRSVITCDLLPPAFLHCNLHPSKEVYETILKKPIALHALRLFTVTTPEEFNATLANRLRELSSDPKSSHVNFTARILPHEAVFLLSRLLLECDDIRARLDSSTLIFLRSHLTSARYEYLLGMTVDTFIWEHGSFFRDMFSKHYKKHFRQILQEREPTTPKQRIRLLRICLTQAGLGLNQHNGKSLKDNKVGQLRLLKHSANIPWKPLQIDLDSLVAGLKNPVPVVDLYKTTECEVCCNDEKVECLRQNGLWRCTQPPSLNQRAHRDPHCPLDVVINQTDNDSVADSYSDTILEILGFRGGAQSNLRLSKQEIEGYWRVHCPLRASILQEMDVRAMTGFMTLASTKVTMPKLLPHVRKILAAEGLDLIRKRKRRAGKQIWLYSLIKI